MTSCTGGKQVRGTLHCAIPPSRLVISKVQEPTLIRLTLGLLSRGDDVG